MAGPDVILFTALDFEARAIAKAMKLRSVSRSAATAALPNGGSIWLHTIGPGAARIPADLPAEAPAGLIMAGLGGGLSPELRRGDVVVDEASDIDPAHVPGPRGRFHSSPDLVCSPEAKARLFRETGAGVVDMENATARAWAAARGIPFLGIRGISDAADEPLDPAVARLVDPDGRLSPRRLAAELWRRPAFAGTLWSLRASAGVMEKVAAEVRRLIEAGHIPPRRTR
jgi:adenosylhomocysteine nucleosidase